MSASTALSSDSTDRADDVPDRIVFFDGVCGLCNQTVRFLIDRDSRQKLRFAPLQGTTAGQLLDDSHRDLSSLVFWEHGKTFRKSTAMARILGHLGSVWSLLGMMLRLVPRPVRDAGYDLIARYRYRWFGKLDQCRLPRPEEAQRFLP